MLPDRFDVTLDPMGIRGQAESRLRALQDVALAALTAIKESPNAADTTLNAADGVFLYLGEPRRMDEGLRLETTTWICRSALEDAFEILMDCCDESHRICFLAQMGPGPIALQNSLDPTKGLKGFVEAVSTERSIIKVDRGKVEDRLKGLKDKYGVTFPWEQEIDSLRRARNCLAHRLGIVHGEDCQDGKTLTIHLRKLAFTITTVDGKVVPLKTGPLGSPVPGAACLSMQIVPTNYVFSVGDSIAVAAPMLSELLTTVLWTAIELTTSVATYVQAKLAPPQDKTTA
ncbi:MAG: hypothetical protein JNK16_08360 [Phycisphaerales bacterium]|nr:hypothetical protein [Phycisphaerales bacterium]